VRQLVNRELGRWMVPALAMLVVFVLYTSVAAIVIVASGGPTAMATAIDGTYEDDDFDGTVTDDGDEPVEVAPTEPPDDAVIDPRLTATCAELFSPSVVSAANAAGLVLNPTWAEGAQPGGLSLQDPELASVLATLPAIDCRWVGPNGDSGIGIRSVVALVDANQTAWLAGRFGALGYRPQSELGSTRYFFEANAGGTPYGESHFVREGVWFSTHWVSYGPKGYTADMVNNYFS
jgi:hypothetical protein